jgi:hypothetical protein
MVLRMATLKRRASGAYGARITIPRDVKADHRGADGKRRAEEIFFAPADCPEPRAQVQFSQWQADIKNRGGPSSGAAASAPAGSFLMRYTACLVRAQTPSLRALDGVEDQEVPLPTAP